MAILRVGAVVVLGLVVGAAKGQGGFRTLSGAVTDHGHEPLKGAVVQVQDEATGVVQSYLSEKNGAYHFKRLLSQDDYKVWATYHAHRSKTHEMSHFESKADKVVGLMIRLD